MPNYITNILVCDHTDALESILNHDEQVDFNKIIPMPEYIKNTSCGSEVVYIDASIKNYEDRMKTERALTPEEIEKGAGEGWYDWSIRNWGTKWNALNTKILHYDIYSFQTAWRPPVVFLMGLSRKFPDDCFYLCWKDEGCYGSMNQIVFLNGEIK